MRWIATAALCIAALGTTPAVFAQGPDLSAERALFIKLRPSAERGNWPAIEPHLDALADYPLLPDLRAAWLRRRMGPTTDQEMARFLNANAGLGFANGLRLTWARSLAARGEWDRYLSVYDSQLAQREDTTLDCWALRARIATGPDEKLTDDALPYWLSAFSQPKECDPVFEYLEESGALTPERRRTRIDLALEAGQISLARYLARPLPAAEQNRIERWARMQSDPARALRQPAEFRDEDSLRLAAYGLRRLARRDPVAASQLLPEYEAAGLTEIQIQEVRRRIALTAAHRFMPEARELLAETTGPDDEELIGQWRVRLALREQDWAGALAAIDILSETEAERENWRYWRAYSLARADRGEEAAPVFEQLAATRDYYGFLAADQIDATYTMSHAPTPPDEEMILDLASRPAIIRCRELFLTGLNGRGRLEWTAAMAALNDDEKEQASILAHRWGWHSRAIRTASRHGLDDDLELRFPLPWQESFELFSERVRIEPTWAYGVARSESLFMPDVASSAGAIGLMQLMPATGKETARKNGISYRDRYSLMDPDKNIALGTSYLAEMLARFDNNRVLATAAYNAGPHRVERWLPADPGMPATVWVESVPFRETRRYVRRVLAAETVFDWRMNGESERLSERMPPVPSRDAGG
jgi:soluble lytic murein transglycosylase